MINNAYAKGTVVRLVKMLRRDVKIQVELLMDN